MNTMSLQAPPLSEINILLVDGSSEELLAMDGALSIQAYNLIKANSGREAIEHALSFDFAVILLVFPMPEMDGFEIAKLLRESPRATETPIIFITDSSMELNQITQGYESGLVDYILKPAAPGILKAKVDIFVEFFKKNLQIKYQTTLLQKMELQEKELLHKLNRSNKELEEFTYIASHDLREPLHVMSSFVYLLEKRLHDRLDNNEKEYFEFIKQGILQGRTLVKALLDYSRIGKNETSEELEISSVLKEVLNNLKVVVEESDVKINYLEPPIIKANYIEMMCLFHNLIDNAIKFRTEKPLEINISFEKGADEYMFIIQDNGIGIDPQYKERIFEIFQRLNPKSKYPGTGIGLAICKKIVENYNGKIWVESTLGNGAKFSFTLKANV